MTRRVAAVLGLATAFVGLVPAAAWAHGIGGRGDLPVPVEYFVAGASVVLVVTFVALAVMWPEPRLQEALPARSIDFAPRRFVSGGLALVGVVGLVLVVLAGALAARNPVNNIGPVLIWVYFWLVIPFLSALVGNIWRDINPWRTISRVTEFGGAERPDILGRLGVWPATAAFLAFTWLELVYPDSDLPRPLAAAALVYSVYLFGWIAAAGRESGLGAADAFTTYNGLISSISPIGRDEDGGLVWRGWLRGLAGADALPGTSAFVVAMIGTVTYDGLSATPWWDDRFGDLASQQWFGTLALLGTVAVLGAGYWFASWVSVRLSGEEGRRVVDVARSFAHTLVPIALAYAVAHYFTLIIFEGQLLAAAISDPFGRGWDLFGTADRDINFWLSPTAIWYVQLTAIVGGHVLGVVLAHDRALVEFKSTAVRTQYAMLGLMVALTGLGLVLLSAG